MIREAEEKDCINLAGLSLEVWFSIYALDGIHTSNSRHAISTFTEKNFSKLLVDSKYRLLVYIEETYIRGFVLLNLESFYKSKKNGFEIDKLYVHSPLQGKGVGKSLLTEVRKIYGENFWLHSWVRNKSIEFYKKYGFQDIGKYEFKLGDELIENRVLKYAST